MSARLLDGVIEAIKSGLPPDKDTFGKALDAALHALDAEEYDDCPALIPREGWRIVDDMQFELEPAEPHRVMLRRWRDGGEAAVLIMGVTPYPEKSEPARIWRALKLPNTPVITKRLGKTFLLRWPRRCVSAPVPSTGCLRAGSGGAAG